ncbi:MAG: restriction endonuclease subunit S [Ekhidna sp.]|nr:restriction endonuclease subunit S [Ekhidna sp.]
MKSSLTDLKEVFESKETKEWRWSQLKDIAGINPRRPRGLKRPEEAPTTFVPMPSVDGTSGNVSDPLERPFGEIKKGYTYFEENDVLFAKITPCMQNGKHVIARNLIDGIGFGTTEFHVIRPGDEIIPEWIHLYIRQPSILNEAVTHFTGSVGQQRVPSYFLEDLAIPLPSLSEQKRIAAILNDRMADIACARAATEAQLEAAEALSAAYLREIFESKEAKQWPKVRLGDHASKIGSGVTPRGGQSAYKPEGIPLIRSQNIYLNRFIPNGLVFIDQEQDQKMRNSRVEKGDVLLNITGASIGRVCVVPDEICPANVNQHVSIIRTGILNPDYLSFYMSNPVFQSFIMNSQSGATRQALTKSMIEDFFIPCPPTKIQLKIVKDILHRIKISEKIITDLRLQMQTIDAIPSAVLNNAFNGEL